MMRALLFVWVQSFADLQAVASEHALRLRLHAVDKRVVGDLCGYRVEFAQPGAETWAVAVDGMYVFAARVSNQSVINSEAFQKYTQARQLLVTVGGVE